MWEAARKSSWETWTTIQKVKAHVDMKRTVLHAEEDEAAKEEAAREVAARE